MQKYKLDHEILLKWLYHASESTEPEIFKTIPRHVLHLPISKRKLVYEIWNGFFSSNNLAKTIVFVTPPPFLVDTTRTTGCSGKINVFLHNSLQPLPRLHRYKPLTFKTLNAMQAYTHSYWLVIFVQPIAAESWRGRCGKLSRFFGNTIFN